MTFDPICTRNCGLVPRPHIGDEIETSMALRGLKVVELAGLAPVPFAGMILAGKTSSGDTLPRHPHFHCKLRLLQTLVRQLSEWTNPTSRRWTPWLGGKVQCSGTVALYDGLSHCRNKRSIAVDLKHSSGVKTLCDLCRAADVFIEPFRPGVCEQLGLGPDTLLKLNPKLVYTRLTGFGQKGPLAHRAGHDINYLAISGVLSVRDMTTVAFHHMQN